VTTIDTTAITVELPTAFDPRWSRLPGIQVDGRRITIDPVEYSSASSRTPGSSPTGS